MDVSDLQNKAVQDTKTDLEPTAATVMSTSSSNRIYGSFGTENIPDTGIHSMERLSHDNLMPSSVAEEFNTYRNWNPFRLYIEADELKPEHIKEDGTIDMKEATKSTGVRSLFNKLHAVPLENAEYGWRVTQNMPLLDSPKSRRLQRSMNSCTVRDLVRKSQVGLMGTAVYDWSDFMYCKYLGKMSNNYMITLRRYTIPIPDYVKPYGNATASADGKVTTQTDNGGVPLGCMVTWLGTPGNEMNDILKYSFNMPFKSINSKFESDGRSPGGPRAMDSKGIIGGAFQKTFGGAVSRRLGNCISPGVFHKRGGQINPGRPPHYDDNHKAYAGIDMIKSIYIRDSEAGLKFSHKFKLQFDYELRSYDGVNGKQAMLDLLGNILTVCYTTGDFWPGAYRSEAGASSYEPLSSLECMRHHNTFSEYVGAFERDFQKLKGNVRDAMKDPIGTLMNLLDNLGGVLLGGELEAASPGMQQGVNALLSDSAVGQWHVTVGNPCAPILSIGNLVMTNCTVEHYGPLGLDDFPTGLRVICEFDSGKPRDKRLIERMYIGGNDRIYMPLDQSVFEVLKNAKNVNQKQAENVQGPVSASKETVVQIASRDKESREAHENAMKDATLNYVNNGTQIRVDVLDNMTDAELMKRFFGANGAVVEDGLRFSAGEVNRGVAPKQSINIETTQSSADNPSS